MFDIFEPNNTIATAPVLQAGTYEVQGADVDWYRINTTAPGAMSFTMTPLGAVDVNLELYNSAGQVIAANFAVGTLPETISTIGTGGTYYLKVYSAAYPAAGHLTPHYRLTVAPPEATWPAPAYEPNNSLATAVALNEGAYKISGLGNDYFRIQSKPGLMTFTMTPAEGTNVNLELLNSAGVPVGTNFSGALGAAGRETVSFYANTEETYYLRTYSAANPDGPSFYNLDVTMPKGTWSKSYNFGPMRDQSVGLYDLDGDGKDEIVVGTSKGLDAQGNEILPAGLLVINSDGSLRWSVSFPAVAEPDSKTGKIYQTTSVTTAPLFTDVNNDGVIDIVVGVGADPRADFNAVGQPGDKGGIYAISGNGQILWSHINRDSFGGVNKPDGRPDGVYAPATAFDIDSDGVNEVIYTSWDHYLYILDGRTGAEERVVNLHDTTASTPKVADLNNDGVYELVVGADITTNLDAGIPVDGGILHVVSAAGVQTLAGWNAQIGTTVNADYRGFYEPQVIWSSPQTADLNGDGRLEVIHGTGNFHQDNRGDYVTVRNSDGTLLYKLNTIGRPAAAPLIADINNDGRPDIIQATLSGYVHAWNHLGQVLFSTQVNAYGVAPGTQLSLNATPIAVDMNNDGNLELLVAAGSQVAYLNSTGQQINDTTKLQMIFNTYGGSIAARDIDRDGRLDIITGAANTALDRAMLTRWENPFNVTSQQFRDSGYQGHQSLTSIDSFVERFYTTILGRSAEAAGNNYWNDSLFSGVRAGADVARGFIFSQEFLNRNTADTEFVNTLYSAFFNRPADQGGFDTWINQLKAGTSRAAVLDGFIFSQEFNNLCATFGIRPSLSLGPDSGNAANSLVGTTESDMLRSGGGNDTITDTQAGSASLYGQVYRLYGATLAREPDSAGLVGWVEALNAGTITLPQAAGGFVDSQEFKNVYQSRDNTQFVTLLYQNVLGRAPDTGGLNDWLGRLNSGSSRGSVVLGFSESAEYQNRTQPALVDYMRMAETRWTDVIEGGSGNDTLIGGRGGDIFIFRQSQGGTDVVRGFEPWDELQFLGFGYSNGAQVMAKMQQQGANVVFSDNGQVVTFENTNLAAFRNVRFNLS